MRTAAEIAEYFIPCTCDDAYKSRKLIAPDCPLHAFDIESAINEARKEAIEECASKVRAYYDSNYDIPLSKDAILSLIDEIK